MPKKHVGNDVLKRHRCAQLSIAGRQDVSPPTVVSFCSWRSRQDIYQRWDALVANDVVKAKAFDLRPGEGVLFCVRRGGWGRGASEQTGKRFVTGSFLGTPRRMGCLASG